MANRPRADNPHRSVRVETPLWEAAKVAAKEEGTTRAEVMQQALRDLVARGRAGACAHEFTDRGVPGDRWRECWLCGEMSDWLPGTTSGGSSAP